MWIVIGALVVTFLAGGLADRGTGILPVNHGLEAHATLAAALPWIITGGVATLLILAMSLRHWRTAAVASLMVIAFGADTRFHKLGSEFMPSLNEGSILDMPTTAPRIAMAPGPG